MLCSVGGVQVAQTTVVGGVERAKQDPEANGLSGDIGREVPYAATLVGSCRKCCPNFGSAKEISWV